MPRFSLVIRQQSPCLTSVEQDGDKQRSEKLEFGFEADVAFPYPIQPGHRCCGRGDPDFCSAGAIFRQGGPKVLEAGHFLQGLTVHGDINTDPVCTVHHHLGLLCADFHAICTGSCNESAGEVMELIATASHKVDVMCKPEDGEWPATNGDGGAVVLEVSCIHFSLPGTG